jgi:dihydrolipoamide dehydrogenase
MHIVILGSGPGGYEAALYASRRAKDAKQDARITLVEERELGGTCLNRGCIPTKALLASAECLVSAKNTTAFGITPGGTPTADFSAIIGRKDKIVAALTGGIEYLMNAANVTVVKGRGTLTATGDSRNAVRITTAAGEESEISCDKIIIATGSAPASPALFQIDGKQVITSDEALSLGEIPASIVIAGGGVIGCEIGQFFRRMGSDVSIVEMMGRLLPLEDADCSKQLERQFRRERIKVLCARSIASVQKTDSSVKVILESADGQKGGETLEAEKLLVSIGRRPATKDIGLEGAGISVDEKGYVPVNRYMQTKIPGIYAIGDIVASPQLAHVASKEAFVAVEHIFADSGDSEPEPVSYKAVPRCVYTDPEIACVGLTEEQAGERGIAYRTGKFNLVALGKAKTSGKTDGFVKLVVGEDDAIIGAAIAGAHATEMISALTLAVEYGLSARQIGACMFPHPTLGEAVMEAAHDVHQKSIHKAET